MDTVGNRNLVDLWRDLAENSAGRTFLVFEDRWGRVVEYTYGEFDALINKTANLFLSIGVTPGSAVAVHMHNCPELLMCMFGLAKIGAVLVPLHPRNTREECSDIIGRVEAIAVVCEEEVRHLYGPGMDQIDVPHVLLARGEELLPGTSRFETERDGQPTLLTIPATAANSDADQLVAGIVFTSGTTARPKGVELTHYNLVFSGEFVNWQADMTADDRLLTTMPACHVNFQLNALMPVLTAGATLIAVEKYSATNFWRQVCHYEATIVQGIAMMVRTMLMQPETRRDRDNRVREILYYLPITDDEKAQFEARFNVRLLNSYGTSETLVGVITDPPHGPRRWPSIGQVGPNYEARIADDDGHELPPGKIGEIQIRGQRGRTLMKEYFRDPASTEALFNAEGWMHTGDLGYMDDDGWYFFLDRKNNLIKRAGENVSPAEVEAVLVEHPGILEAAVLGVPDPMYDQAVKALVVLSGATPLRAEDIRTYCRGKLADFKVPTIVEIVQALPQTGSFKLARSSLK